MNKDSIITLEADYLLEKIENEITVYHPSLTTSIYLNESGAVIWELCDGKRTIAEIIDILVAAYPENAESIEADVLDIIGRLVDKNIARLRQENKAPSC
ncbi:MAG: pyrroloquinoline quinone biosynthesis peptide chaperone PqqD [Candidatus Electrothrix aestuarii]|uniref:Pyrroloquinoline quinone biosynthesis peptide chaperone PqqD n=1 Tax=Candidatus Electrothrix aestuarii TaxID=3062594 RepID=A0AAU8LX57_9BACT|nr:pyrroloquinoline quinone biosynthesis peptide chaperone PqqD [Candidatus Electrothrix aestuarii]